MSVLEYLIPLALLLGFGGLMFFVWTIHSGQYEDLEGAAHRILIDDEGGGKGSEKKEEHTHIIPPSSEGHENTH